MPAAAAFHGRVRTVRAAGWPSTTPAQLYRACRTPPPSTHPPTHASLAHVELNAIDLAWDTVLRFSACGLPEAFYADFAR